MDPFLKRLTNILTNHHFYLVESLLLLGSKVNRIDIDFWSDTDLVLVLCTGDVVIKEQVDKVTERIGKIIAKEEYQSENMLLHRLVLLVDNRIERIDLKVCTYETWMREEARNVTDYKVLYGKQLKEIKDQKDTETQMTQSAGIDRVERVWFLLFECVKKFMRNDNLIGLHLLLGLLQEYLVFRMQERDMKYQINIHHQGYSERLPEAIEFTQIKYQNKLEILKYLRNLATEIDSQFDKIHEEYESRVEVYEKYINDSCKFLRG